jgi:hypothetical protein
MDRYLPEIGYRCIQWRIGRKLQAQAFQERREYEFVIVGAGFPPNGDVLDHSAGEHG